MAVNHFHIPPNELARRLTYHGFLEVLMYLEMSKEKEGFKLDPADELNQMVEQYGHLLPSRQGQLPLAVPPM